MKTNIVICVLSGLPGAGKTTLAKKLMNITWQGSECELRIAKLSFDDLLSVRDQEKLVLETKNNLDCKTFKEVRTNFVNSVISTISALKTGDLNESCRFYLGNIVLKPNQRYVLILDDNFYYKSMRYKFFQIASDFNCGFCQVYLECCQTLAEERNSNRPEKVSKEVIQAMSHKMEPPCRSNFWEAESVVVQSQKVDSHLKQILDLLIENFEKGLSEPKDDEREREQAQSVNFTSLLHRADLILRALVGEKMRALKQLNAGKHKNTLKEASLVANSVRHDLLTRLGKKTLIVPPAVFEDAEINYNELRAFLEGEFRLCSYG